VSSNRRVGLVSGAVGLVAAAAGAALVADRTVARKRREGVAGQGHFVAAEPTRAGFLPADDGVALYYEEDGPANAPVTVVLVHGFCLNHGDFLFQRRALLDRFGDRIRIVGVDQRGHGRSARSSGERATIDQLGADLHEIISRIAPAGRLVLVGHSMGGMSLLALVDAHPELFGPESRVAGVMLLSTSTGKLAAVTLGLPSMLAKLRGPVLPLLLRGARRQPEIVERGRARATDVAWVFLKRLAFGGEVDPALVEYLSRMIAETRIEVIADFYSTLMDHDKLAALDELRDTPVAIICGERDLLTPPEHSQQMADALPKATLTIVPGGGHQVLMEYPESINVPLLAMVDDALAARRTRRRRRGQRPSAP
jgi:pimeloyl-ACP methyl ester carboxylesterase